MTEAETVENAELLVRIFGEWPSFHDGEERHFSVCFDANRGVGADLLCDRVVVESVAPYEG
ncbi:MAG TPA: hypothetical protein VF615_18240 [Longimicrobiaceae bacterium]|jgi:hypothetical protein